jgi:hypothetical protein
MTDALNAAKTVIEEVHTVAPTLETFASLIPGVGGQVALALKIADSFEPFVINALSVLARNNGGDWMRAAVDLANHLHPAMPNADALTPPSQTQTDSAPQVG